MNNTFDVLIVGGGVSGMSCALVLGSAKNKPFAAEKKLEFSPIKNLQHYKKQFLIMPMELLLAN